MNKVLQYRETALNVQRREKENQCVARIRLCMSLYVTEGLQIFIQMQLKTINGFKQGSDIIILFAEDKELEVMDSMVEKEVSRLTPDHIT